MRGRFLVNKTVHFGYRIDARDIASAVTDAVYLVCEEEQFLVALYSGPGPEPPPIYALRRDAWPVEDLVNCMTCLVTAGRRRA